MKDLENEILKLKIKCWKDMKINYKMLSKKRKLQLENLLQEKVKGALIRARFSHIRDMDGPTSFLFNLERKVCQEKQMLCLRNDRGMYNIDVTDLGSKT